MIKYYAISFVCTFILYACNNNPTTNNQANYIEALQQKAKNNPNDVQLQYEITNSLDSAGNYSAALQSINALIINDSLNNMYWFTKGQVQEHLKDTVGAILSYHRSIRVYPSPDVMLSLANLYAESKNEASLTLCNNIMQLKLGKLYDAHCLFISGVYFSRTSNFNKAILLFDECINNNYTYTVAYLEKGFIYYDQKKYTDALKIFQLAATVSNRYADAYYWQAKCYEAMNNTTKAIEYYEKSLVLDNQLTEASIALKRLQ